MMFTIEVKKRGKDEEFSFKDLEMFHQECKGGRIRQESCEELRPSSGANLKKKVETFSLLGKRENSSIYTAVIRNFWALTCQRCEASIEVEVVPNLEVTEVIMTAIDGQKREIGRGVAVIQKT